MRDASGARLAVPRPGGVGLLALLGAEFVALMLRFDTTTLRRSGQAWWAEALWDVKMFLPPLGLAIATAAILIGGDRLRRELRRTSSELRPRERVWPFLLAHLVAFALFARLTAAILEGGFASAASQWPWIASWLGIGAATLLLWVLCLWPPRVLARLTRRTGSLLAAAVGVGLAAWMAGLWTETWWEPLRDSTLALVAWLVRCVASDVVVDAPGLVVGTSRFSVRILSACSGYEGIGLVWVFLAAYLWLCRRALRFPRAFLLVPIGTAAIWLANAVRLAALIAVGTWISPDVALGGFHTYSGALLFCAVALGLATMASRTRVFARAEAPTPTVHAETATDTGAAAYLLPFLVLVGTMMLTGLVSRGTPDLAYPLRVAAVLATLWQLRRVYRPLSFTWSWGAIGCGALAFVLWMALEPAAPPALPLDAALGGLPRGAAVLWLACRVLGSVVAVPLAEELAFRGYLGRRLVDASGARLAPAARAVFACAASSLLFGAMHTRVLAATVAGALYFLCMRRRGELGDAVLAHATTNALIAVRVLATGDLALWT
ncbi:MAG TPA: exosortase E/protease, VPEID-CTERM system [Candidatus Binatia bacterium]|jgi:exosortase E/protease (VPEID-CTERM system)